MSGPVSPCGADQVEDFLRRRRDVGARAEDRLHAGGFQEIIVLLRDHPAADHQDIPRPLRLQRLDQLGRERLVPGGLAADPHDMHVVVDRVLRGLLGRLEQRAHVHVEADVGEGGGDDLRPAVVAVLAHLDHQHPRAAPLGLGKGLDVALDLFEARVALVGGAIDPGERFHFRAVAAEDLFHGVTDLSD